MLELAEVECGEAVAECEGAEGGECAVGKEAAGFARGAGEGMETGATGDG
jgi:hypothetical protein